MIIVCDLDGTLADCRHRQHLAAAKDWDGFHELMNDDPADPHTLWLLKLAAVAGHGIIFLTGRPVEFWSQTRSWIEETAELELGTEFFDILMRPEGEYSSDYELKPRILMENVLDRTTPLAELLAQELLMAPEAWISDDESWSKFTSSRIDDIKKSILILDDRDRVVETFRNGGWKVYQCAEGAF